MSDAIEQRRFHGNYVQLFRGQEWLCTCKKEDADAIQALLEGKDGSSDNRTHHENRTNQQST